MYGQLLVGSHALPGPNLTLIAFGASHALSAVVRQALVGQHRLPSMEQPQKDVASVGFYLSGGTSNTSPDLSLGGQISSERMAFQTFTQIGSLPGVTIQRIGNSSIGTGVLSYEPWGHDYVFKWVPYGWSTVFGRVVSGDGSWGILTADGIGNGFAVIDVDWANLGASLVEAKVAVRNTVPNIFSDLTPAQAASGYVSHRCIFIKNENATSTLTGLRLSTFRDGNTGSIVKVGVDLAGPGDGVSTGVATTPADETSSPGIVFGDYVDLPNVSPGQCIAVWIKRTIYAGWYKELNPDVHLLLLTGGF